MRSITSVAPISCALATFSAPPTTGIGFAPKSRQIWIAMTPRPPTPPQIRTFSPACILARVTSIRHAVSRTSGIDAASSKLRLDGFGSTLAAGIVTYSEWPPSLGPVWNPQIRNWRQKNSWPDVHISHVRQERPGWTTTSSPTATCAEPNPSPLTSAPTAFTTPATSEPATCGKITFIPGMPRRAQMSLKLAPAALTSISTSNGFGSGSGMSVYWRTSGPPCSSKTTAFMP